MEYPVHWEEVLNGNAKGIWMIHDPSAKPDIVLPLPRRRVLHRLPLLLPRIPLHPPNPPQAPQAHPKPRHIGPPIYSRSKKAWRPPSKISIDPLRNIEIQNENLNKDENGVKGQGDRCFVEVVEERGRRGVHAWPIVSLFLSDTREERIAESITKRMI